MKFINKLLAIIFSLLIISLLFLVSFSENGNNINMKAEPQSILENCTSVNLIYNCKTINIYGNNIQLTIYSTYGTHSDPVEYANITQIVMIWKWNSQNSPIVINNLTFNTSACNFYETQINLGPGHYKIQFATLIKYYNSTCYLNNKLPKNHSAFLQVQLPEPDILIFLILIEIPSVLAISVIKYRTFSKEKKGFS
jgi:hypothetical protein